MYRAFGLLTGSSNFSLDEAVRRLSAKFPNYTVTNNAGQITVASPAWELELRVNSSPEVAEQSIHFAEKIGGEDDAAEIAGCTSRVEVWSETPDYEMAHFADYLTAIEVLKSFDGVIAINPEEPGLM